MSLTHTSSARRSHLVRLVLCLAVGISGWLLGPLAYAQAPQVEVTLSSTPPFAALIPDVDLALVTLTATLQGKPLSAGQVTLRLIAPPRPMLLSTDFPHVEGTTLVEFTSDLRPGTPFTWHEVFPIRGVYTLEGEITPVPDGPAFRPTTFRHTIQLAENPSKVRNAWLLIGGLCVVGVIVGVFLARSAAAREHLLQGSVMVCLCVLLGTVSGVDAGAQHTGSAPGAPSAGGTQRVQGPEGWELEVRPMPEVATVGQTLELTIVLRHNGVVVPDRVDVTLQAVHQEESRTVLQADFRARSGQTTQRLQFFDGAPHTITVTARPVREDLGLSEPLTATLGVEVTALHPPMALKLKLMTLLLGVLVVGMVVGFVLPRKTPV